MQTQHDTWHAPSVPHAHPSEPGPSRLPAGPQGRHHGVWRGLQTSLGMGLVIVLLASLGGPAIASDRSGQLLVAESFDRSDTGTWGTTDSGQRWRLPAGQRRHRVGRQRRRADAAGTQDRGIGPAGRQGHGSARRDHEVQLRLRPDAGCGWSHCPSHRAQVGSGCVPRADPCRAPRWPLALVQQRTPRRPGRLGRSKGRGPRLALRGGPDGQCPLRGHQAGCHAAAAEGLAGRCGRAGSLAAGER